MKDKRPVNLDLMTIQLPLTAYTSILHRISGVLLFLAIPLFLCMLNDSLTSPESFDALKDNLNSSILFRFIVWLCLSSFLYHLLAGIKHLIMDFGFAEEKESGKRASVVLLIASVVSVVLAGIWLW